MAPRHKHRTNGGTTYNSFGAWWCDVHGPIYNSAMGLGHSNGSVTMWSPSMSTLLTTTLCHHGPVTAFAFEQEGLHMVIGGMDGNAKM